MNISTKLDRIHARVRRNRWHYYFSLFCRCGLALGFLPSGFVKVNGERFTDLHNLQPMGAYLEAIYHTGYYYTSIGIMQILAAILLLIPRTATLGAIIYFPIILNICVLSLAVRFEGSLVSAPLMVLANLYLLCWDYHKLKFILPFNHNRAEQELLPPVATDNRFPFKFFGGAAVAVFAVVAILITSFNIMPRNTLKDCQKQCVDSANPAACLEFCDCVHLKGGDLDGCLEEYERSNIK